MFSARHHAKEFVVRAVDIVISRCKNDSIEKIFGRWRSGSDLGIDLRNKRVNIWYDHLSWERDGFVVTAPTTVADIE